MSQNFDQWLRDRNAKRCNELTQLRRGILRTRNPKKRGELKEQYRDALAKYSGSVNGEEFYRIYKQSIPGKFRSSVAGICAWKTAICLRQASLFNIPNGEERGKQMLANAVSEAKGRRHYLRLLGLALDLADTGELGADVESKLITYRTNVGQIAQHTAKQISELMGVSALNADAWRHKLELFGVPFIDMRGRPRRRNRTKSR
jgi:hypothetical protein